MADKGIAIWGARVLHPPILLAHLRNISSARQRCVADKTRGKSYLSTNSGRGYYILALVKFPHSTVFKLGLVLGVFINIHTGAACSHFLMS